jgi:ribosomal protein S27E
LPHGVQLVIGQTVEKWNRRDYVENIIHKPIFASIFDLSQGIQPIQGLNYDDHQQFDWINLYPTKEKSMKCPGQDTQYWKPGAIFETQCPKCGNTVEFFKDDTTRKCDKCGHRFVNPDMDFGCAAHCPYAEQCIGDLPAELIAQQEDLLKDRVAIEMKRYFKNDFRRIGHASRVARYAERIGKKEKGNLAVILTCLLYTSPSPRDRQKSRMPSSA